MIDERKNVQTTPTRTYCKRSTRFPYSNLNKQDAPAHNIHNEVLQKQGESPVSIQPGYYSFQHLADISRSHKISMSANENSERVTLGTPTELKISKRLKSMLGFFQTKWGLVGLCDGAR